MLVQSIESHETIKKVLKSASKSPTAISNMKEQRVGCDSGISQSKKAFTVKEEQVGCVCYIKAD